MPNESGGHERRENTQSEEGSRPRRPYAAPELIEYGTVAKLTQTGGQTAHDSLVWNRMGTCL
jgi:hypothetical protein